MLALRLFSKFKLLYFEIHFQIFIFKPGTRVHTVDDFGFVVLDIDWLFPRDAGEYMCRATNKWGQDTTKAVLKIQSE